MTGKINFKKSFFLFLTFSNFAFCSYQAYLSKDYKSYTIAFLSFSILAYSFYDVFNNHQDKLQTTFNEIKSKFDILSGVTDQISNTSQNLSNGAVDQAEALEQTSSATEEIYQTANKNTGLTEESKNLINLCLKRVQEGERSMKDLSVAFHTISSGNQKFEEFIKESNQRFEEIKEVISQISEKTSVINDIVFQTKLLAFNASVEAARAGEHGKGFAVVAEEVGSLAAMSGKASHEISDILEKGLNVVENIIQETSDAVDTIVSESIKNIENGEKFVKISSDNFSSISEQVDGVFKKVNDIAQSSKEQSLGIDEVNKAIHLLEQNNQRTTLVARQSSEISKSLQEEFNSLDNIFKKIDFTNNEELNLFVWDEKYRIGVDAMDDEHQILIKKINDFVNALKTNTDVKKRFQDMKNFTVKHFEDEERFMQSINYSSFSAHQKIHRTLIDKVLVYERELEAGTLDKKRLIAFLKNWLVSHILGVDTQYAEESRRYDKNAA